MRFKGVMYGLLCLGTLPLDAQIVSSTFSGVNIQENLPTKRRQSRSDTRISLEVRDSTRLWLINTIAQRAGLKLTFNGGAAQLDERIDVKIVNLPALKAVLEVLKGSNLVARLAPDGTTLMVRSDSLGTIKDSVPSVGQVIGKVIDSVSNKGVSGATVTVVGTSLSAVTREGGEFRITDIPVGPNVISVKILGYQTKTLETRVDDNRSIPIVVRLQHLSTTLAEVVTTATGSQRRLEVANAIGQINADSVVRNEPIQNLSDLLRNRVPGVEVTTSSGDVGAPSRIRIRGINSIEANNDPIIILDGIRVSGGRMLRTSGAAASGGIAETFRLDDIDPTSVETIEVVRGPSAAALYGADAANGVIVIKTKRGAVGRTRWGLTGEHGWTEVPGKFPLNYKGWGHTETNSTAIPCMVADVAARKCIQDSVSAFNPLNDPRTTTLGQGTSDNYSANVSGGASQIQYALNASVGMRLGPAKLSANDGKLVKQLTGMDRPPSWMRRPNAQNTISVSAHLTLQPTPDIDMGLTTMVHHQKGRNGDNGIPGATSPVLDTLSVADALSRATRRNEDIGRGIFGLSSGWRTADWLTFSGMTGLDYTHQTLDELTRASDCIPWPSAAACANDRSARSITRGTSTVFSGSVGSTLNIPFVRWFTARTAFGAQYSRTIGKVVTARGVQLGLGSESINTAKQLLSAESERQIATGGWYVEQSLGIQDRFFVTAALRRDAGSSFGGDVNTIPFPKIGVSWLASDESWFPFRSVINAFRLRASYGEAGVQPGQLDVVRTYRTGQTVTNGQLASLVMFQGTGNALLTPERVTEWEGGVDIGGWNDRLTIVTTAYRKINHDALVSTNLAPSLGTGNGGVRRENLGDVLNRGEEFSVTGEIFRNRSLGWSVTAGFSRNTNRLIRLDQNATVQNNSDDARVVVGYPLFGRWSSPILGYADRDGDGVLAPGEIVRGDTSVYLGSTEPKYSMSINTSVVIAGNLSMSASFAHSGAFTQLLGNYGGRGVQDASSPIQEQARSALIISRGSPYLAQTVSLWRFNSLSLSYQLSPTITRVVGQRPVSIQLMGSNLALWTRYAGKDPGVNSGLLSNTGSYSLYDSGATPPTRSWTFRVRIGS